MSEKIHDERTGSTVFNAAHRPEALHAEDAPEAREEVGGRPYDRPEPFESAAGGPEPYAFAPFHEFVEHNSEEVEMRVIAPSLTTLFAEAGHGLSDLIQRKERVGPAGPARLIELRAHDAPSLLINWLSELVYGGEVERAVPVEIEILSVGPDAHDQLVLRARSRFAPLVSPAARIKAGTLPELRIDDLEGSLRATVILEI